jgi:hypothetical protein
MEQFTLWDEEKEGRVGYCADQESSLGPLLPDVFCPISLNVKLISQSIAHMPAFYFLE